jgi:formylglycine-generating enzyme required for sulfatase activity
MKFEHRNLPLFLAALGISGLLCLFGLLWLSPPAEAGAISGTPTRLATISPSAGWDDLLQVTPFAYTAPLPEPTQSPIDGTYAKVDPSWPQWWLCRRCADYRPAGGIWKLQFDQGVMRIYYDVTGWHSLASFTVSGDRLTLFNDPYCGETGEYTWKKSEEGQLELNVIEDGCSFELRGRNLSNQPWLVCLSPNTLRQSQQPPGCVDNPPLPPAPADLPVTVTVHGGDSRFFETPPDIIAFANGLANSRPEGIHVTYHSGSIPFGFNRVLWWNGDWIEASTDRPFTAMGIQFMGDPQTGWARVLFDGVEVWRGNTTDIWSKAGRHGGYIEISGFGPGPHTLRAESLGFDYHPVPVASFGFSEQGNVNSVTVVTRTTKVDGAMLVYVPAGQFLMGSDQADHEADQDEKPQHIPFLDAYWLDRTEVTNAMYTRCIEADACTAPMHSARYPLPEYAEHPVSGVTWFQAGEYCRWAGRRLPTEAEWEKAARGTDGRLYPWGNTAPDDKLLNFGKQVNNTTPVGSYPAGASPYGALDMAGNVWEWVADGYDPTYYAHTPTTNPPGGISANQRVVRGGAWGVDARAVRSANRFWAFPGRNDTDGFRCAVSDGLK